MFSRTGSSPSLGNRIVFGPVGRTDGVAPSRYFARSRNAGLVLCRDLNRGNPAAFPAAREPFRDAVQFVSAWAAFTDAVSNTSADTSPRHARPRTCVPSASRVTGASGARPSFHAFMWLMNDTLLHDRLGVRSASAIP